MRKSLALLSCVALLALAPGVARGEQGVTPSSTRHSNIPSDSTGASGNAEDSAMSSTTSGTHKTGHHRHRSGDSYSHTGSAGSSKSTSTGGQSGMDTAGPGNAGGMNE